MYFKPIVKKTLSFVKLCRGIESKLGSLYAKVVNLM